jgi:hypothetical protein
VQFPTNSRQMFKMSDTHQRPIGSTGFTVDLRVMLGIVFQVPLEGRQETKGRLWVLVFEEWLERISKSAPWQRYAHWP